MTAVYYEIRIAGMVPSDALRGFEQLVAAQPTETLVFGPLPDRAALNALLAKLEASGIQLVSLRKLERRGVSERRYPSGYAGRPNRLAEPSGPG